MALNRKTKFFLFGMFNVVFLVVFGFYLNNGAAKKSDEQDRSEVMPQQAQQLQGKHVPADLQPKPKSFYERFEHLSGPGLPQDDPNLVRFIREEILEEKRPYMQKLSHNLYVTPQAAEVTKILNNKTKGFYVECGGLDGERSSNTIWLEHKLKWKGLLVEMDPSYYLQLRGKNRNSYTANVCLSPEPYPVKLSFDEKRGGNAALNDNKRRTVSTLHTICLPFYSMMVAMNVSHIDYFSLDVEGRELAVLKTIPFDKIDISVLSVEYLHLNPNKLKEFMESQGYETVAKLSYSNSGIAQWSYDYIFVKKGLGD